MHRLLKRQLRQLGLDPDTPPNPSEWAALLKRVNRHYQEADQERYLLERSLTISSREMRDLYESLRHSSETQIAEERDRLQALIETVDDGILLNDASGTIYIFNTKLQTLIGYSPTDANAHPLQTFRQVFPDYTVRRHVLQMMVLVAQQGIVRNHEVAMHTKDGQQLTLSISMARLRDQATPMYLTVLRDITERKQAEAALHKAKEAAEAGNLAKSRFLANMSHELRTPLNAIIGFANVLRSLKHENLEPDQRLYLERIFENGKHLLTLINDVLDLSKIEAGRTEVTLKGTNLETLIGDIANQLDSQVKPGVTLDIHFPNRLKPLHTDARKLKQILINLVGNALKFTEAGHVTVRVFAHRNGAPRRIDVKDTGIGISEAQQKLIFQPFQQADSTTARRYGGTGLGLSISRALCQQLGFRLTLQSTQGKGSTFSIHVTAV